MYVCIYLLLLHIHCYLIIIIYIFFHASTRKQKKSFCSCLDTFLPLLLDESDFTVQMHPNRVTISALFC